MSDDIFSQLSPEQLQQLMHLGTLNQRSDLIQQQMQQAIALRKPSGEKHITGFGAAVGGLADIGNSVVGQIRENKAREALDKNMTEQEKARSIIAELLRNRQAGSAQPMTMTSAVSGTAGGGDLFDPNAPISPYGLG
jgi:hypothetical protein